MIQSKEIFITGIPRVGKTSLVERLLEPISSKQGFITREIRERSKRVGFEIVTASGEKTTLASVEIQSPYRVSKYYVDKDSFENTLSSLFAFRGGDILYIDEIGEMELFSDLFKQLVIAYLDSPNIFLATVSKVYTDEFIEALKGRSGVAWFELTGKNSKEVYHTLEKIVATE